MDLDGCTVVQAQPDRIARLANSITSHITRQSGVEIGEANRMAAAIGTPVQRRGFSPLAADELRQSRLGFCLAPALRWFTLEWATASRSQAYACGLLTCQTSVGP
jgi:hypothetical protein